MPLSVIAPQLGFVPDALQHCRPRHYEHTIAEIQRFRGRIYVHDKAIPSSALDNTGRHYSEIDYRAWHIVAYNSDGVMCGVMRAPVYQIGADRSLFQFEQTLGRMKPGSRILYENIVRGFINYSAGSYPFVCEPSGWAVDKFLCTRATAITLAAMVWVIGPYFGHFCAVATATTKHYAADQLVAMGGYNPLCGTAYERFYDPFHGCEMAFIFFQSDRLKPRFGALAAKAREQSGLKRNPADNKLTVLPRLAFDE